MLPDNFTEFIDDLTIQVKSNIIPISRIDDAVERILRAKFTMGLFESPLADLSLVNQLGSQVFHLITFIVNLPAFICSNKSLLFVKDHRVRRSLVLLKNGKSDNKPLLPLEKKVQKVLVAGTHSDNLGYQCGGWTVEWQGVRGNDLIVGIALIPTNNLNKRSTD